MALRTAVATGNWSNPAIWNGGVLPGLGDVVASNNFTVTIDQNINVGSLTNAAQSIVNAIPAMTSDTTPSGIASGFFTNGGATYYKAFDKDVNNNFFVGVIVAGDYIQYEFANPIAIDQFAIQFGGATSTSMSLQGWNGSSWVNLLTTSSTSVSFFTSGLAGNSTLYNRYRIVFNTAMYIQLREVYFYEYLGTTAAVAGGTFTVGGGRTITCTGAGLIPGAGTLLTWNGGVGTVSNINSTYIRCMSALGQSVVLSGLGTINITSEIAGPTSSGAISTLYINQNATVNIVGSLSGGSTSGDTSRVIWVNAVSTVNITGNIIGQTNQEANTLYISANATVRVTGDVTGNGTGSNNKAIVITTGGPAAVLEVTGSIISNCLTSVNTILLATSCYFKHIGTMIVNGSGPCLSSTSASAINILSGPFVSSPYGFVPFVCIRMHFIPSITDYFEFRDETTNGALSPGAIAPATRMIAPAAVSDAPAANDVRFGTVYANGSLTGTLKMPSPVSVAYGIPVDNTVGSAVINAEDIWKVPMTSITTTDSIGTRLKNVSTVQTTAAQLAAFN
jgi:hypothetical protein